MRTGDFAESHLKLCSSTKSLVTAMTLSVATRAQSNQVLRRIPAKFAPALYMVNLQVLHCATVLATPTISF
jgi:hypothetical protein